MSCQLPRHPSTGELRRFHLFDKVDDDHLLLLSKYLRLEKGQRKQVLVKRGDSKVFSLFLFEGELLLVDENGDKHRVQAEQGQPFGPVAADIPRCFDVICIGPVLYLVVDHDMLDQLQDIQPRERVHGHLAPSEGAIEKRIKDLLVRMRDDLEHDRLPLPSLPEVAIKIGKAIDEENCDAQRLAAIVQNDPAITAKLMRAANMVWYSPRKGSLDCAQSIMRLGFGITHKLVLTFALQQVFRDLPDPVARHARQTWDHSARIAAICFVLARQTRLFDPQEALLAGLLHDIGVIPILHYVAVSGDLAANPRLFAQVVKKLGPEVGVHLLRVWGFPQAFQQCALEAEHWDRDTLADADYCDLLICAQLYETSMMEPQEDGPDIELVEAPAYRRLSKRHGEELDIQTILQEARDEMEQFQALLAA